MTNQDASPARDFHQATKLVYINLSNKPSLYKAYPQAEAVSLPEAFPTPQMPALEAIQGGAGVASGQLDLPAIAGLLYHSAGVIRKATHATAGEVHYRAAASAGALYPVETYLVCQDLPGLEAGIYHFAPAELKLHRLRSGDYRGLLAEACGGRSQVVDAPLILVYTTIFWRSAWKYRTRGYRYCYWDTGTVLANLLASAASYDLAPYLVTGFVDEQVHQLLSIDGIRESAACLVPISGNVATLPIATAPALSSLPSPDASAFGVEITYPESEALNLASRLRDAEDLKQWRGNELVPTSKEVGTVRETISSPGSLPLGESILNRGSTRRFAREAISLPQFQSLLRCATRNVPADYLADPFSGLVDTYTVVNAVEGLEPGSYFYDRETQQLQLLQTGAFRHESGHLGFEQALPADASAVLFFMANLEEILGRCGNRGYRIAQMEAGLLGGRMYLGSHSLGFGATGLTFYDDAVTEFFSPHAAGKSAMFVVPLGRRAEINRVRPFRSRVAAKLDALARGAGQTA